MRTWLTSLVFFFFFNDTATTEIYTLSLHDALPISKAIHQHFAHRKPGHPQIRHLPEVRHHQHAQSVTAKDLREAARGSRSEEHTSELQSRQYLVCRLLLEKKKKNKSHRSSNNEVRL